LARLTVHVAQVVVGVSVRLGHGDRLLDQTDGRLRVAALVLQHAHEMQGVGMVRRHSEHGIVDPLSFVQATALVTRHREENGLLELDRHGKIDRRRDRARGWRHHIAIPNAILAFRGTAVVD
jgi:hypothetical protein